MKESNGTNWGLLAAGAATALGIWMVLRRNQAYDLRDKVVLITGGSRGLGLVLAREFGAEGARVAICARNEDQLRTAVDDLAGRGVEAFAHPCDVGELDQVEKMIAAVRGRFGRIDVLVNNAGTIQVGPMESMTLDDYDETMKTHFRGPLHTILTVLPEMKERGEGRIVNVTSIGGKVAVPHLLPYSASKFALVGLSEGLRAELSKYGIRVTTAVPGLMRTGSPPNALFKGHHRAEYAWFSISDSLPGIAVSAERAARQIVQACRRGEAESLVGWITQAAVVFNGLCPGLMADLMSLVNMVLPGPGGIGTERRLGRDSESSLAPSVLTTLTEQAARRNNELSPV